MRTAGIAFLSFVPVLAGFFAKIYFEKEEKIKHALIVFFEHLQFEIDCFLRPQEEIFFCFQNSVLEKCGFLPVLRQEVQKEPWGVLERSLAILTENIHFTPREEEALHQFAKNFGMQSKKKQIEDCESLLKLLKMEETTEKQKRKTNGSILWTCGICLGIGIFILLI